MKNRKGFTLVELLITITILGIILAIAIPVLTTISKKDISTQLRIYEKSMVTAGKLYNDSYIEDTFGKRKNGCAKISYSQLKNKDLIKDLKSNQLNCAYKVDSNDSSGLIVRKIDNKYYYETILWCENKSTGEKEQVAGNSGKLFYLIDEDYCDETASEDKEPPIITYRNTNFRYYYNRNNMPKPQIKISDSKTGLNNKPSYNYIWQLNSNTYNYHKQFIVNKGTGLIPWKNVPLYSNMDSNTANEVYKLNITERNISDLVGNSINSSNRSTYIRINQNTNVLPERSNGNNTTILADTFKVENKAPIISITLKANGTIISSDTWTNKNVTATVDILDSTTGTVKSGLYKIEKKDGSGAWTTIWKSSDNGGVSGNQRLNKITKTYTYNTEQSKTYYFRATDWAGNISQASYIIKIDKTPPSNPTVNMYLKNNSTDLNASSNVRSLTSYSNNTWTTNYIFTKASGSTDAGSGGVYYLVTTSGAVGRNAVTNQQQNYKNVNAEGVTTIKYKACDALRNCTSDITRTIKEDRTAPSNPTVNMYLKNNSTNLNASSNVRSLTSYSNDTWTTNYIFTKASGSTDAGSGGVYYLVTTSGAVGRNAVTNQQQNFKNVDAEGITTIKYKACDALRNCTSDITRTIKEDRSAPSNPTVNMYLKNNETNLNGSSNVSRLSSYSNNTWCRKWVFTKATDSTDAGSGGVYYLVTTSGAVGRNAVTDQQQAYKNVNAEGTTSIKYKACDRLENCTSYISKTIKLDRGDPEVTVAFEGSSGTTTGNARGRWNAVKYKCKDEISGCTSNTSYTHVNLTSDLRVTFSDQAGNTITETPIQYAKLYLKHIVGDSDNPPNYSSRSNALNHTRTETVQFIKIMSTGATKQDDNTTYKMQFKVDGKRFIGSPNGHGYKADPITGGYWTHDDDGCGKNGKQYATWGAIEPNMVKDKTMYSCYYCSSCSSNKLLCSNGKSCSNS